MGYLQKNENTDEEVKDFLWHMMGVEINDADLDRTHRLPSKIKSYKSAVNAPPPPPPHESSSSLQATI